MSDRADRIGDRRSDRKSRRDRSDEADDTAETTPSVESETQQTSQTQQTPVTDRNNATFYLSDELLTEIRRVTKQTELDVDVEYDTELEKNRHLRPLLLYLGAQQLTVMDAEDVVTMLDTTDVLDTTGVSGATDTTDES